VTHTFLYQQLPADRPVRTETQQPAAPASQAPSAPPPDGFGALGSFLPLLLVVPLFIFMWWSTRSQQKKQEKLISELKKGDRVLTQSGLVGKLLETGDRYAKLEIAAGVKVDVLKTSLLGKDTGDNAPDKK
jgi:preprotein translocase subunit YajC